MKNLLPLLTLIIGAAAGWFLKPNNSIGFNSNATLLTNDSLLIIKKLENQKYNAENPNIVITPVKNEIALKMRDYYGGPSRANEYVVKTDINSFLAFANSAKTNFQCDSIEFILAKHIENITIDGRLRQYKDKLTSLVTFTKTRPRLAKDTFSTLFNGEQVKYFDVMTLCPPDCN